MAPFQGLGFLLGVTWGDAPGYHIWAPLGHLRESAGRRFGGVVVFVFGRPEMGLRGGALGWIRIGSGWVYRVGSLRSSKGLLSFRIRAHGRGAADHRPVW